MTTSSDTAESRILFLGRQYNKSQPIPQAEGRPEQSAFLSTFNVPNGILVRLPSDTDELTIDFLYDNREPEDPRDVEYGNCRAVLGKNSRKILGIRCSDRSDFLGVDATPPILPDTAIAAMRDRLDGSQRFIFENSTSLVNAVLGDIWRHVVRDFRSRPGPSSTE